MWTFYYLSLIIALSFSNATATKTIEDTKTAQVTRMKTDTSSAKERPIFCTTDVNRDRLKRRLRRRKRYVVAKRSDGSALAWDSDRVTWALTRPSAQVNVDKQRRMIRQALAKWSAVTPLTFVEVSESPDVDIIFARGEHGSRNDPVFDGPAKPGRPNSLGHAWGPGRNRKTQNGDVHFDEDDDWTDDTRFMGVAVHELGHSLGLLHSSDPGAIMFPAYRDSYELGDDDIKGAQFIYGSRDGTPRPRPVTTPRTRYTGRPRRTRGPRYWITTPPPGRVITTPRPDSLCFRKEVDAIIEDPFTSIFGYFYVIMGDMIHHIANDGTLTGSFHYNLLFPGAPTRPDVVFSIAEKKSIFVIKDNILWQFNLDGLVDGMPKSLQQLQFPEKPLFALSLTDLEGKRRIYLFGRYYWWQFELDRLRKSRSYSIEKFSEDYPKGVQFATKWFDERLYAVTKDSYVVIDLERRIKVHDEPLLTGKPEWFNRFCQSSSSRLQMTLLTLVFSWTLVLRQLIY